MAGNQNTSTATAPRKGTKMRSPAYPGINLETALKRAKSLYEEEKKNDVAYPVAVGYWGFGPKSSGGLVSVAAMKSFGLLEDVERGPGGRVIKLTDLAWHILLDKRPNSPERQDLIKQAALRPKIHATLWRKYGVELPSDTNLKHALVFDFKFNENTVDEFIKEYKETIRYAGLTESDTLSSSGGDKAEEELQTEPPVEENPMQEQQLAAQPSKTPPLQPKGYPAIKPVGSSIPVSKNCVISVSATGEVTQKGIDKLIEYLNLIKDSFPESEGAEQLN